MRVIYIVILIFFIGVLSAQTGEVCANEVVMNLVSVNFGPGCDFEDGGGPDGTIIINDLNGNNLIFMEVDNLQQITGPIENVLIDPIANPNICGDDYSEPLGFFPVDQSFIDFSVEIYDNDGPNCNGFSGGDDNYSSGIVTLDLLNQLTGTFDVGSCISFNYELELIPYIIYDAEITGDSILCFDAATTLSVESNYDEYLWSNGSIESSIDITEPGMYGVTVSVDAGCERMDFIVVEELEQFVQMDTIYTCFENMVGESIGTSLSPDGCEGRLIETTLLYAPIPEYTVNSNSPILFGTSAVLSVDVDPDAAQVNWYGPDGELICSNCNSIEFVPSETINYEFEIDYHPACQLREIVEVVVESNRNVYVPNIFTPDSFDGNNLFKIYGPDVSSIDEFYLYDRWGSIVYKGSDINAAWDGKKGGLELVAGVYVYLIEVTFLDGTKKTLVGDVTLLH